MPKGYAPRSLLAWHQIHLIPVFISALRFLIFDRSLPNSDKPPQRLLTVRRQFQLLRLQIRYTPEALQIIEANATERKRCEFVSNAVVAYMPTAALPVVTPASWNAWKAAWRGLKSF